jgi:hypothetical protein
MQSASSHRSRQKKRVDLQVVTSSLRLVITGCHPGDAAHNPTQLSAFEQISVFGFSIASQPQGPQPAPATPLPSHQSNCSNISQPRVLSARSSLSSLAAAGASIVARGSQAPSQTNSTQLPARADSASKVEV